MQTIPRIPRIPRILLGALSCRKGILILMEDEITLKDLLIHFSRNIKKIMIVVVLCAFIFAIFGLYKGMEESNDATSNENQIAYQKALEVHNEEINYLKNSNY